MKRILLLFVKICGFRQKEPSPRQWLSYSPAELEADPALKARVMQERWEIWLLKAVKPKAQYTGSLGKSESESANRI
jgi:hypothetical protein